jgi:hypothetical protein
MSQKFLTGINLDGNQLEFARIHNLASAPASPGEGQVYYNTTDKKHYQWNGTIWVTYIPASEKGAASGVASLNSSSLVVQNPASASLTGGSGNVSKIPIGDGTTGTIDNSFLNKQDHTFITDFHTTVEATRLDQLAKPTATLDLNDQQIINLAAIPFDNTSAVNKGYVDGLLQGLRPHASVRVATTANLTSLAGLLTIDNIALNNGDRILVKNQTLAENNGIRVASAGAWVRAVDLDTWDEAVAAFIFVEEGDTQADTGWVCTANAGGTLNTTPMPWVQFSQAGVITAINLSGAGEGLYYSKLGTELQFKTIHSTTNLLGIVANANNKQIDLTIDESKFTLDNIGGTLAISKGGTGADTAVDARAALGATGKYVTLIGDTVLSTFTVTHNLASSDVVVSVYESNVLVHTDVTVLTANTISVAFAKVPALNQYKVVVMG